MEHNILTAVYTLLGLAALVGAFKGIDWLIALKYKTKDECTQCREKVQAAQHLEDIKLTRIETKVDLLINAFHLAPDETIEKG